jgi:hypothetical protein
MSSVKTPIFDHRGGSSLEKPTRGIFVHRGPFKTPIFFYILTSPGINLIHSFIYMYNIKLKFITEFANTYPYYSVP